MDLGHHNAFRSHAVEVNPKKGRNVIVLKLNNMLGSNYCGWTYAFRATLPDGTVLTPRAE